MLSKQHQYGFRSELSTTLAVYVYMKTFCKTEKGLLPLVVYSVIYLRPLILLIMRYFHGSWKISMGLEVNCTNFLLVICKTDSSVLLLGV